MLKGTNCAIIDVECEKSPDDCRHCGTPKEMHLGAAYYCPPGAHPTHFERIGWDNHAALGLSIGCTYDYQDQRYRFFDRQTLEATMRLLVERQPLLVSFNGLQFDGPLMAAVSMFTDVGSGTVLEAWNALWERSYDVLYEIWQADPTRKFERGLNSLDALSKANSLGAKEMDGAKAPVLWRQGRYAEVASYNLSDVWRTKKLFEQILQTGMILRGDGKPINLPLPTIP